MEREASGWVRPDMADPLAAAHQDVGQREAQHQRALDLGRLGERRGIAHGGGAVDPEPDGVGRLPFALAHIMAVVARRAAPVDAVGGLACVKALNCQNASPGPGLAAAVDAVGGGGGDAPRLDGDAGQAAREVKRIAWPAEVPAVRSVWSRTLTLIINPAL